jgi:hypothetical protein
VESNNADGDECSTWFFQMYRVIAGVLVNICTRFQNDMGVLTAPDRLFASLLSDHQSLIKS